MSHDPCFMCGCITPSDQIRDAWRKRLHRVEITAGAMSDDERAVVYEWITRTLDRAPFDRADIEGPFKATMTILEALRLDLSDITIDPASPYVEGAGIVPQRHWREVAADGGITTLPYDGGTFAVDGLGMTE